MLCTYITCLIAAIAHGISTISTFHFSIGGPPTHPPSLSLSLFLSFIGSYSFVLLRAASKFPLRFFLSETHISVPLYFGSGFFISWSTASLKSFSVSLLRLYFIMGEVIIVWQLFIYCILSIMFQVIAGSSGRPQYRINKGKDGRV